jgi:hypothetical protein
VLPCQKLRRGLTISRPNNASATSPPFLRKASAGTGSWPAAAIPASRTRLRNQAAHALRLSARRGSVCLIQAEADGGQSDRAHRRAAKLAVDTAVQTVTRQFNRAQSMGRLTLNSLVSFAQFEGEIFVERFRVSFGVCARLHLQRRWGSRRRTEVSEPLQIRPSASMWDMRAF